MGTRAVFARSLSMAIRLYTAKVIDLDTAFDAALVETVDGPVIWATVTIEYILAGLNPTVNIRAGALEWKRKS